MDRSYKIYKSYHTSHHNTTKTHLQISTPPSSVQQRTDIHNLPQNHKESQASKLQASSNAPTLTTSPANHKETQPFLPAIQRSADGSSNSRESTQSSSPHQSPLPPVAPHPHHYLPPGTEQPGRRHPPSTIHHPPQKKSAPQPIQPAKNALLISISLQSYTITYDQHTIPYDRIKYNS